MTEAEEVRQEMAAFWGVGPGSDIQLAQLAGRLRGLERDQVSLIGGLIPRGVSGTPVGMRCERLRDMVSGLLLEPSWPKPAPPLVVETPPLPKPPTKASTPKKGSRQFGRKGDR